MTFKVFAIYMKSLFNYAKLSKYKFGPSHFIAGMSYQYGYKKREFEMFAFHVIIRHIHAACFFMLGHLKQNNIF